MDNTVLGTNKPHRSLWAVFIVLVVTLLFGLFWWYQKPEVQIVDIIPLAEEQMSDLTPLAASAMDLSAIETELVNTEIGDYSSSL